MPTLKETRKIVTVKICDLEGEVTIEQIQKKIKEAKKAYKYDWVKFYMGGCQLMSFFSTLMGSIPLYAQHYQTPEQVEKDNRHEMYKKLQKEFEPQKKDEKHE